jgi:GT2 family glycosyltransferase
MQKNKIDLSIIIISLSTDKYHTKSNLELALNSMKSALSKVNYELIVVNNSTRDDGTEKMCRNIFKDVKYLERNSVFSFCNNNNYGLKKASGRYILFLNNDVEVIDEDIFRDMVTWMDNHQDVGASTSALINSDKKTLQPSGGYFPSLLNVFLWMTFLDNLPFMDRLFDVYHPNINYFKSEHDQDWITGAFYLVRKDVLDETGGFDEEYGAYVEEVDLSYRIKQKGFKIKYLPKWRTVHFGGQSYGNENSLIYELRNLKLFYKKHYPSWQLPVLDFTIKFGCVLRMIVFSLIRPKLVKVYAKAFKNI